MHFVSLPQDLSVQRDRDSEVLGSFYSKNLHFLVRLLAIYLNFEYLVNDDRVNIATGIRYEVL